MLCRIILGLMFAAGLGAADANAEAQARQAMDRFMQAFNARDVRAWASTLNYPHVRFASNQVRIWNTLDEFASDNAEHPARLGTWHHSRWESMTAIQSGAEKVHFAVTFVRYDKDNREIGKFPSLYVLTLKNGRWGVQARSSFAP